MKIGDLVQYQLTPQAVAIGRGQRVGTIIEFPSALHAKEFQKVRVLTEEGMQDWIMQFCKVINEGR